MFSPKIKLDVPKSFEFPFVPYKIQDELMKSLYSVLENKEIGIFESPTGTGKSLTLATSAIQWLLDHNNLISTEIEQNIDQINKEIENLENSNHGDWIETQSKAFEKKRELLKLTNLNKCRSEHKEKIREIRERIRFKGKENVGINNQENKHKNLNDKNSLEEKDSDSENSDSDENKIQENNEIESFSSGIKIFFCSRTHSQLSQVVREIKRINFAKEVRCISLASRQNLCINQEVRKLSSIHLINEKCLEMQKNSKIKKKDESPPKKKVRSMKTQKCPYKSKTLIKNLKDLTISEVLDIEDLVSESQKMKSCPYYSSRLAIKDAQVIMLPYQMLFHRSTRNQSGICLKNNIVIIDEAHNLLDTITNIYSANLELNQLNIALTQLTNYKEKYFSNFSTKNLLKINQIIFIVKRLIKILQQESKMNSTMIKTHELMYQAEFYNIDIFGVLEFCENTHFAEKVHSFAQRYAKNENSTVPKIEKTENKFDSIKGLLKKIEIKNDATNNKCHEEIAQKDNLNNSPAGPVHNVIRPLLTFLDCLTECAEDGGVIISFKCKNNDNPSLKFVLLNPARHFKDIIQESRSVIIAGGTMQPIDELTNQLFKECIERVKIHIYDHIVPQESILPIALATGPSGKRFCFNFQNKNDPNQLKELAQTIFNVCNIIPAGIVCFVSSYEYLENLWSYLNTNKYISLIENKKFLFRETKSNTAGSETAEHLLVKYSKAIKDKSRNGALIFSVVGGKLSEGLNFADDLGRCIIVVGLPYPNKTAFELQEKMKYLDIKLGNNSGNDYYENLCMKAVNQCIGRSIRHIKDYAVVLLIDERYTQDKIKKKLPHWISRSLYNPESYGQIQRSIAQFFREKNKMNN